MTAHEATHAFDVTPNENTTTLSNDEAKIIVEKEHQQNTNYSDNENMEDCGSSNRKSNEFVCKFCGKRYAYASSLYVHTRLHTGERPFKCNYCDKSFTNQGNMQVHKRVHTGEKPYVCLSCGKSYAQKVGLKIHQEQCKNYSSSINRRASLLTSSIASCASSPNSSNSNESISLKENSILLQSSSSSRISPRYFF